MIFALFIFSLRIFCTGVFAAGEIARTNMLRTTNGTDNFILFETEGNTIRARGRFSTDRVRKMYFYKNEDITSSYSMKVSEDGAFEADLTAVTGRAEELLVIKLTSGAAFGYTVRYDSGWYFPVNALTKNNRLVLDHIYDLPDEAARYYLSATGDEEEIRVAQEQIRLLTSRVTEGLDGDYDKARAICEFVATTVYYDFDARNSIGGEITEAVALYDVLKSCRAICSGYANLYCAMLEAAGIDGINIKGGATSDELTYEELDDGPQNHEFTAFYCKEQERWVWVDSCWCGSGSYENGTYKKRSYHPKYFDITDEALSLEHRADVAERRSYFAEIKPPETEADEVETETVPIAEEENASDAVTTTAVTMTAPETTDFVFTTPQAVNDRDITPADSVIYIVAASALAMAVAAMIAVIIRIFIKGKESAKAQRDIDMVVIELENGKQIKLELYPDIAPETVANFEKLVGKGFYDGLTFHRVIRGFMIQGGCPLGNGTGNSGEHIKGEFAANGFPNALKHTRGVISMARAADPNSASCQFFIMHEDAPHLDGSYAAFGKVIEGMDAVDEIASCETDYADKPVTPVVMKSVKIVE